MTPALIFDIVVIAALLISAVIAFLRGFIREVLTIFGVIGGLFAAYLGGPGFAAVISGWMGIEEGEEAQKLFDLVPYPVVADIAAYGSIFIIVVIILSVISHYLAGLAKALGLGAVDRTFGVAFGIVRGIVLLALLYLPAYLLVDEEGRREYLESSRTRVYVEATASYMAGFIPESMTSQRGDNALADTARDKLQELEVLRDMQKAGEKPPANGDEDGYDEKERGNLDRLIEGNLDE